MSDSVYTYIADSGLIYITPRLNLKNSLQHIIEDLKKETGASASPSATIEPSGNRFQQNAFADKFGDSGSYENTFRDFSANHNSGCKPFSDGFGNTSVSCPCGNTFQDFSANDKSFAGELGDSGKL